MEGAGGPERLSFLYYYREEGARRVLVAQNHHIFSTEENMVCQSSRYCPIQKYRGENDKKQES